MIPSWPGDDWNTILCGGKDVFAPHSAHKWAPVVFDLIFFLNLNLVFSLFKRRECMIKSALLPTYHVLMAEIDDDEAKTFGQEIRFIFNFSGERCVSNIVI